MNLLETIGVEKYTTYTFEVKRETFKGAILRHTEIPQLEVFAYTSLQPGALVYASVQKAFENAVGKTVVIATVETVLSYPECTEAMSAA